MGVLYSRLEKVMGRRNPNLAGNLQVWEVKEPYLDLHCLLGEGPFYEEETHSLRFVDIRRKQIHTVDLAAGPSSLHTLELADSTVSVTADIEGVDPRDKIVVGLKYGLALLDRKTGQYEYLQRFADGTSQDKSSTPVDYERIRGNDGAADPHGRFWLGSMTDFDLGEFQPEGGFTVDQTHIPPMCCTELHSTQSTEYYVFRTSVQLTARLTYLCFL